MKFHTGTAMSTALRELLAEFERRVEIPFPINMTLAGGMAVHLYTASRTTRDVDAEFSSADPGRRLRIGFPADLTVPVDSADEAKPHLYFGTNYNSTFGLIQSSPASIMRTSVDISAP